MDCRIQVCLLSIGRLYRTELTIYQCGQRRNFRLATLQLLS